MRTVRHKIWIWLGKVFLAGVIAFIALTLFCVVYYKVPPHYHTADTVTDYVWKPGTFRCTMREGVFVKGHINNEGYSNAFDYTDGLPIDSIIMGSSHMEAFQVDADQSVAYLLNALATDGAVYNLGLSSYNLLYCADDLPGVLERYHPSRFVIIVSKSLAFDDALVQSLLDGSFHGLGSRSEGLEGLLQEDPYLRLLYKQVQGYTAQHAAPASGSAPAGDPALLSALLAQMSQTVTASGAKLIIAYHPAIELQRDGSILFDTTQAEEDAFAALCEKNGIYFLSMRDRFQAEYDEGHILPYGFANTSVGTSHLNRYGHEMMAEELYTLMQEVDP